MKTLTALCLSLCLCINVSGQNYPPHVPVTKEEYTNGNGILTAEPDSLTNTVKYRNYLATEKIHKGAVIFGIGLAVELVTIVAAVIIATQDAFTTNNGNFTRGWPYNRQRNSLNPVTISIVSVMGGVSVSLEIFGIIKIVRGNRQLKLPGDSTQRLV